LFLPNESNSKVAYIDLSDFSGNHITGVNLNVENHQAEGYLSIPDSITTGTYLLRSSLNHNGYKEFYIRDLLIANRFTDLASGSKGSLEVLGKETINQLDNNISISLPNNIKIREKSSLKLNISPTLLNELAGGLTVSISKHIDHFQSKGLNFFIQDNTIVDIIEENKGIVISGKVINKTNDLPASKIKVFLSIPDSIPDFQYYITRADGSFYFLLKNIYGKIPIVIQTDCENENDRLKLILNKRYTSYMPDFPTSKLELEDMLIDQLVKTVECFTFQKIYADAITSNISENHRPSNNLLFYGEPTITIIPNQFYDLPDFTEISRELLEGVKFREKNEKLSLNLLDKESNYFLDKEAFVIVDGVPIQDLNIIKNMGTSEIEWIHMVLGNRFHGDLAFSGVLAISTGKYDLKWIKESDHLIKLDFQALQDKENSPPLVTTSNIPDLRSLLYWKTNTIPMSEMYIDFNASDIIGAFKVRVAGKKKNGELVVSETVFDIN